MIVSRTDPALLIKLFEMEVPEIYDGTVQIRGAVREAGERAKVAVISRERDVDPVGACVGMKGTRVQSIIRELRGEKIDIVEWSDDPATFVMNALSPAKVSRVSIVDEEQRIMEVVVEDKQLSLAIGKKGQNVRLAAKIVGWRIDIKSEEEKRREVEAEMARMARAVDELRSLERTGSARRSVQKLVEAGVHGLAHLLEMTDEELSAIEGVGPKTVEKIREAAAQAKLEWDAHDAAEEAERLAAEAGGPAEQAEQEAEQAAAEQAAGRAAEQEAAGGRAGGAEAAKAAGASRRGRRRARRRRRPERLRRVGRMANVRVFSLARDLNLTSQEVIDRLKKLGVEVKTASSSVDEDTADKLRRILKIDALTAKKKRVYGSDEDEDERDRLEREQAEKIAAERAAREKAADEAAARRPRTRKSGRGRKKAGAREGGGPRSAPPALAHAPGAPRLAPKVADAPASADRGRGRRARWPTPASPSRRPGPRRRRAHRRGGARAGARAAPRPRPRRWPPVRCARR